ncbi:hypothetical protein AB1284_25765 [Bacillus sp. S2(2024)]|uniref:hypothetical protein n=1 Tax=Bacillus sp. S2(2024) TaxID=3162887 RepID=UPI003D20D216
MLELQKIQEENASKELKYQEKIHKMCMKEVRAKNEKSSSSAQMSKGQNAPSMPAF